MKPQYQIISAASAAAGFLVQISLLCGALIVLGTGITPVEAMVVVDMPQVISLPPASPEAWDSFWDTLPPPVQLDEQPPATGQAAQTSPDPNKIELLRQLGGQDT